MSLFTIEYGSQSIFLPHSDQYQIYGETKRLPITSSEVKNSLLSVLNIDGINLYGQWLRGFCLFFPKMRTLILVDPLYESLNLVYDDDDSPYL